ncbi:MAG: 1,3-beta-galactosyl-N-acetylhexosamine phosphorylase N-terminal domain-containing protein [Intestinimonas sp.]
MSEQDRRGRDDPHGCGCGAGDVGAVGALGADAIRDCDGTGLPRRCKGVDAKVYSTYYTTRKDNGWARGEPGRGAAVLHRRRAFTRPGPAPLSIPADAGRRAGALMEPRTPGTTSSAGGEVVDRTAPDRVVPPAGLAL